LDPVSHFLELLVLQLFEVVNPGFKGLSLLKEHLVDLFRLVLTLEEELLHLLHMLVCFVHVLLVLRECRPHCLEGLLRVHLVETDGLHQLTKLGLGLRHLCHPFADHVQVDCVS